MTSYGTFWFYWRENPVLGLTSATLHVLFNMDEGAMEAMIQEKVQSALKANNEDLLKNIGRMMEKISSPSIVSVNSTEIPKFKRKSNDEQFKHNSKVMTKLEHIGSHISSGNIEKAKESLIEAKDIVKRRQKLIQLADSSSLGWRVVAEYETNPIASDSEDEKRIFKAEARATRKVKSEKSKSQVRHRSWPYTYKRPSQASKSPLAPGTQRYGQTNASGQRTRHGLCFSCGN
ncbi:uncharacterized protein LOC123550494 [Mercenaria mercenaria]|uniref:uncharacterized protein LOC123550494 n=1 Tax=Mercenaria mercenaria TaxID=6596 RepID=UPI00234F8623|nr:uncharacterized protein LOC123550494 [Mercenaria mercenaria]